MLAQTESCANVPYAEQKASASGQQHPPTNFDHPVVILHTYSFPATQVALTTSTDSYLSPRSNAANGRENRTPGAGVPVRDKSGAHNLLLFSFPMKNIYVSPCDYANCSACATINIYPYGSMT